MYIKSGLLLMLSILLLQLSFSPAAKTQKASNAVTMKTNAASDKKTVAVPSSNSNSVAKKPNTTSHKKPVAAVPAKTSKSVAKKPSTASKKKTVATAPAKKSTSVVKKPNTAPSKKKNTVKTSTGTKVSSSPAKNAKKTTLKKSSINNGKKGKASKKNKSISGKTSKQSRIVNGNINTIANFPYMVQVYRDKGFICGGTLISRRFVLTAAHCVPSKPVRLKRLWVKLGATKLSDTGVKRMVSKVMKPTAFSLSTMHKDVAVFKLAFAAVGKNIKPIRLNTSPIVPGRVGKVSGWGTTSETGNVSNQLRVIKVPVLPKKRCRAQYRDTTPLTNTMMCAAKPKRDSCQGDSGGPMIIRNKVAGIVSFGVGCARSNYPGVYTGVRSVLTIIRKAMTQ